MVSLELSGFATRRNDPAESDEVFARQMTPPTVAPRNERVNIAILNLNLLVDPRTLHPSYIHAGICHGFFGRSSLSTRPCLS